MSSHTELIEQARRRAQEQGERDAQRHAHVETNLGFALKTTGETLERLGAAVDVLWAVEELKEFLIRRCRVEGATWEAIAEKLGVSTQAAHSRWRWMDEEGGEGE